MRPAQLESVSKVAKYFRERYSRLPEDEIERTMEQIEKLLSTRGISMESTQSFLTELALLINRIFGFREISVGLKDQKSGLYKYEIFVGMRKETEEALKKIEYTYEDMVDPVTYPRIKLSNYCDFFMGEYRPYLKGEIETFSRPSQLQKMRDSPDEMIEADYFDVYMYGIRDELLGWFELGITRDGKMPSRKTIKWLELIATISGRVIAERMLHEQIK